MGSTAAERLGLRLLGAFLVVRGLTTAAQVAAWSGAPSKFLLATALSGATLAAAGVILWVSSDRLSASSRNEDDLLTVERLAPVGVRLVGLYLIAVGLAGLVATFGRNFWPSIFFRPLGSVAAGIVLWAGARSIVRPLLPATHDERSWKRIAVIGLQLLGIFFLARACIDVIGLIPDILSSIFHTSRWSLIARQLLPAVVQGVCGVVLVTRATALVASPSPASTPLLDK